MHIPSISMPSACRIALTMLPLDPHVSTSGLIFGLALAIQVYFKGGCLEVALNELLGKRRAFIVTDKVSTLFCLCFCLHSAGCAR
jgi:hypothetical protein